MEAQNTANLELDCAVRSSATSLVVAFVVACAPQEARGQEDLATITSRVLKATRAASESAPRAKGEGRFTHTWTRLTEGVPRPHRQVEGTFTFAYSGRRSYLNFVKSPRKEWDAHIFILTGDAILSSGFSPEFPSGAEGWIRKQTKDPGWPNQHGIPPHFVFEAVTYVDDPGSYPLVSVEHEKGLHVIQHAGKDKVPVGEPAVFFLPRRRFTIDPARNYHVVRYELLYDDTPRSVIEKDWGQNDAGLWYVRRYRYEMLPVIEGQGGYSWVVQFDEFEPNADVPKEMFSPDALGLPVGAYLRDYRVSPAERIKIRPPDLTTNEKAIGELPR
jgi:hypothetical protein